MISSKHNFIYIHAPKTGGNSVQSVLLPFSDDEMVIKGHQDGKDRFEVAGSITPQKHATLTDYADALGEKLSDYKVIISVRHPVARAVSFYFSPHRWMRNDGGEWHQAEPYWSLEEFEKLLPNIKPISDFLMLSSGYRYPDHIIRQEHLAETFAKTVAALSLPSSLVLPHQNKSASPALYAQHLDNPNVEKLGCGLN